MLKALRQGNKGIWTLILYCSKDLAKGFELAELTTLPA